MAAQGASPEQLEALARQVAHYLVATGEAPPQQAAELEALPQQQQQQQQPQQQPQVFEEPPPPPPVQEEEEEPAYVEPGEEEPPGAPPPPPLPPRGKKPAKDKKPPKAKKPAKAQQGGGGGIGEGGGSFDQPPPGVGGGGGSVLDAGPLAVTIKAGSGAGKSKSFQKRYKGLPAQGAIVSFEVLFEPGFEWSCRGKVGGISIGPGTSSGCRYSKNGASLRLMWEAKKTTPTPFAYVYVPQGSAGKQPQGLRNPPKCGQGLFKDDFKGMLKTGAWFRVQLGAKLNSQGRADGQLLFSVNGKTKVLDGVMWRQGNEKIEGLTWNVFHGGGCAATKTSSMKIRDVRVSPW